MVMSTEVGNLTEGRMVMLRMVASLMDGEWLCYGGGQCNEEKNCHLPEVVS